MYLELIFLCTLFYLCYKSETRRRIKLLEKFPGPPKLFILGNTLDFIYQTTFLSKLQEYSQKYGGIMSIQTNSLVPFLVLSDPKSFEFILSSTKTIEKGEAYKFLHRWLGLGLLLSGGANWKRQRKILTPAFHFKILEDYVEIYDKLGRTCIDKLKREVDNNSFDIFPYISLCTLDIICETAMGVSMNIQHDIDSEYVKSVKEMCRITEERDRNIFKNFDWIYRLTKDYYKEMTALKILRGYTDKVIQQRKEELKKNQGTFVENEFGIKRKLAFLDLILQATDSNGRPVLTDLEIRDQVNTFMFAGHDTTSTTISYILYCLGNNPDVQDKVVEELKEILGEDRDKTITHNDIQNLKYLELVIKETLRMYPTVPLISRKLTEDVEYDGKVIPKDTDIALFFYGIHKNPELFPNPEKFLPERFAGPADKSPYAYTPFSAGPRNCIGQKFAMLEMKTLLSKLLMNFEVLQAIPALDLVLVPEVVLKPVNGIHIRLQHRK